jgi:spermidine/putrescine-binding protein
MVSASQVDAVGCAVGFDFNQAFVAESWVTSRGFKNLKAAMNFITFSLQVAPQVEFAEVIPYGLVNRKALASLGSQCFLIGENLPKGVLQH